MIHPGAVALVERLGALHYDRLNTIKSAVRGGELSVPDGYLERQDQIQAKFALQYHSLGKKGKLEIQATKQLGSKDAL